MSLRNAFTFCSENKNCTACIKSQAAKRRVDELRAQLSKAEEAFHYLGVAQNAAHDPLSRLPLEITTKIFEEYHESRRNPELSNITSSPFTLGAVCQIWRTVVWSTPRLWTAIRYNLHEATEDEGRLEMLRQYIGRSGILPLTFCLKWWYEEEHLEIGPDLGPIIRILQSCILRTESLDIELLMDDMRSIAKDISTDTSPILRKLRLCPMDDADFGPLPSPGGLDWRFLTSNLRDLDVDRGADILVLGSVKVHTSNLLRLQASGSRDVWIQHLHESPLLRVAIICLDEVDVLSGPGRNIRTPDTSIRLSSLEELELFCCPDDLYPFLVRFTCPNLNSLKFANDDGHQDSPVVDMVLQHFLRSSGKHLRCLELGAFAWSASDMRAAFVHLPSLEKLTFSHSQSPPVSQIIMAIFDNEATNTRSDGSSERLTLLPNLLDVDLFGVRWGLDDNWDCLRSVVFYVRLNATPSQHPDHLDRQSKLHRATLRVLHLRIFPEVPGGAAQEYYMNRDHLKLIRELEAYQVNFQAIFNGHAYGHDEQPGDMDVVARSVQFWKNSGRIMGQRSSELS